MQAPLRYLEKGSSLQKAEKLIAEAENKFRDRNPSKNLALHLFSALTFTLILIPTFKVLQMMSVKYSRLD